MTDDKKPEETPTDVPFVRKPIGPDNPRVSLPDYPGLPSRTGMTTAVVVCKRKMKEGNEKPSDGPNASRPETGSGPKPE